MTLKECLYLLNEFNYINSNIFIFRSKFKNLLIENNQEFVSNLDEKTTIFSDLIKSYKTKYQENALVRSNLNNPKSFKKYYGDNLIRKCESYTCANTENNASLLPEHFMNS